MKNKKLELDNKFYIYLLKILNLGKKMITE